MFYFACFHVSSTWLFEEEPWKVNDTIFFSAEIFLTAGYEVILLKTKKREMVIVLLRHFKQTQDFTPFPRQAIIAHQSKLNSYFRALQYRSLLGADY